MSAELFEYSILLLILLAFSFFFSGSETALFSLPKIVAERLKHASTGGRHVASLLEQPNRLLVTILLGNLAANIMISEIIGVWALRLSHPLPYSEYIGSVAAILLTTIAVR